MGSNKLLLFTICIGVTLALLSLTTTAKNDDVVAENLRLKYELSQLATSLLSQHFQLILVKADFSSLEHIIKEALIGLKTDDERINKLLENFSVLLVICQQKLENVMQKNNGTIASLLKNIEATHAAERNNEGDFVSAVKKAEGFVRDISEKGFVLTKEALKRADAFEKQNIGLSEKMNLWLSSAFDRTVAKYGEYLCQKSKENANEEKEGNDQTHEF